MKGNGNRGNRAQSSLAAPVDKVSPREAISGTGGGAKHLYASTSRQEQENSPDVVTANQNNQQVPVPANINGGSTAARVQDFVQVNLAEFLGSKVCEDPQNFIDELKKILGWKDNRGADAALVTWDYFIGDFLDRYAPHMVADSRAQMSKFLFEYHKGRASGSKSKGSACPKCGKNHPGKCLAGKEGSFGCGQSGHRLKDCPSAKRGKKVTTIGLSLCHDPGVPPRRNKAYKTRRGLIQAT
ncbi:hypothetical protein MTR67_025825 [Solanum verrucosum]|uniref:CCHC-type domain-containing protein n=1 Tax=Solanum verrucosum TaxID=315347 RepID=A0AAF0TYZ0_SOLVR|nr:hypothetical protein MTR67_025825 [Solanum verrucosum]